MDLGTAIASSWSAGISLYAVVAVLGIAGRMEWIEAPELLERPWVIGTALALFALEFVIDKIALLDTVWDAANTVARPVGGALITAAAPDQDLPVPVLLLVGGALALSSHSAKASARALVNASPEPVSNVVVSAVEDGLMAAVMALAIAYPRVAFVVAVVLAVASGITAVLLFRTSRAVWRTVAARIRRSPGAGAGPCP
jgi:hypothetical protein